MLFRTNIAAIEWPDPATHTAQQSFIEPKRDQEHHFNIVGG